MQKERGQFSLEIVHCDGFTSMPATAQALYFQILSVCDDEGFTSQLGMCKFLAHASDEDIQMLVDREFIYLVGEKKVCVVKHWKMNAYLRYKSNSSFTERSLVYVKPNGNYTLNSNEGTPLEQRNNSGTTAQQQRYNSGTAVVPQQNNVGSRTAPTQEPAQAPARRSNPVQPNTTHTNTLQPNTLHSKDDVCNKIKPNTGNQQPSVPNLFLDDIEI